MPDRRSALSDTVAGLLDPTASGPALVTEAGEAMSHTELRAAVAALAARLQEAGVQANDRV